MSKSLRNVLLISDNFRNEDAGVFKRKVEPGKYYSDKQANLFRFNIDIINSFRNIDINKYHIILIDYGLIGDEEEVAIELLKKASVKKIPLAWVGKFYNLYNIDAKKVFPKLKFLHNLPSSSTEAGDVLKLLYSLSNVP